MPRANKSGKKSGPPGGFQEGNDPRRGRGPQPGEGGRPPDWLKKLKREVAGDAVAQVTALVAAKKLTPDQLIRVGKDFDPDEKQQPSGAAGIVIVVTTDPTLREAD